VRLVIGGSLGGMLALELALADLRIEAAAVIAAPARHAPWAIALSDAQRAAIAADPRWCGGRYPSHEPPVAGLGAARRMAMCGYRSPASLAGRFGRRRSDDGRFGVTSWLDHHARTLGERFDAASYVCLTEAMDRHDVGRGRGGLAAALGRLRRPVLVVAIPSDVLYPLDELETMAAWLTDGELRRLDSLHGHDGFLIDTDRLGRLVTAFRSRTGAGSRASVA
jgi:homoserine O-acetyltransferase